MINSNISINDKNILRRLGQEYMDIASLPIQKEKINLWKSLNRSSMQRPMVLIDQLPWNELNVNGELDLHVENPFWRYIENELRMTIYKWNHFPVDMVIDPYITIPKAISCTGYGLDRIVETKSLDSTSDVRAQHFTNQINDFDDVLKIKDMHFSHNIEESALRLQEAEYIFDGIAPVKLFGGAQFHLGVWDYITQIMGVEEIYYELIDHPELMHAVVSRATDATINGIKEANELEIHNDNINTCHCSHIYTDELLPESGMGKGPVSKNCWAFGLAQLFSSASPEITKEFEIPYISKMAEFFGAIYYGCCDRLDDRLDLVKQIPNVRKVSCSPWSDREAFVEKIGPSLIMSNKPTPAYVAVSSIDYDEIRNDLKRTYAAAKRNNVNLEFILKDISTVKYQPERLEKWAQIAMEVVCE